MIQREKLRREGIGELGLDETDEFRSLFTDDGRGSRRNAQVVKAAENEGLVLNYGAAGGESVLVSASGR